MSTTPLQTAFAWLAEVNGFEVEPSAIEYNISYCQGDGVTFAGTVKLDDYIRELVRTDSENATRLRHLIDNEEAAIKIVCNHSGPGLGYMTAEADYGRVESETDVRWLIDLADGFKARARQLADTMYTLGRAFYDQCVPAKERVRVWSEACGAGSLAIDVVGRSHDNQDGLLMMEDVQVIDLLRTLTTARHGQWVAGDLELVFEEEGETIEIDSAGIRLYERNDGDDQFTAPFDLVSARQEFGPHPLSQAA